MASQITNAAVVYVTVCISTDQRRDQSSAPPAFLRGIPVNSPHKRPVTRKISTFDDVIVTCLFTIYRAAAINVMEADYFCAEAGEK